MLELSKLGQHVGRQGRRERTLGRRERMMVRRKRGRHKLGQLGKHERLGRLERRRVGGHMRLEPEPGTSVCRRLCTLVCTRAMGKLGQICRQMATSKLARIRP